MTQDAAPMQLEQVDKQGRALNDHVLNLQGVEDIARLPEQFAAWINTDGNDDYPLIRAYGSNGIYYTDGIDGTSREASLYFNRVSENSYETSKGKVKLTLTFDQNARIALLEETGPSHYQSMRFSPT